MAAEYKTLVIDAPLHKLLKEQAARDGIRLTEAIAALVQGYTEGQIKITVQVSAAPTPGSVITFCKEAALAS